MLLAYPDFDIPFEVHTEDADTQLGVVISQHRMHVAFYSHKLNSAQKNYTTTEQEFLANVENLKGFKIILLDQQIRVYTNHKTIMYKNSNTARVIQWRMVLEDYAPKPIYVPGNKIVLRIR
eukprot:6044567-Ditylum_brightwellii.AAC.1